MKRVLLLSALFFTVLSASAQRQIYYLKDWPLPFDSLTGEITYKGVVEVAGVDAVKLYGRAKSFFFKNFQNAAAVIQVDDPANRVLAAKGNLIMNKAVSGVFMGPGIEESYLVPLEVRVKDGRYRYEISNIEYWFVQPRSRIGGPINVTLRPIFNKLSTTGFKSHISYLRDAEKQNQIFLNFIQALEKAMKTDKDDF